MLGTTEREVAISPVPPAEPRLLLQPGHAGPGPLDGGWWPRSADPAAELPGLVLALDKLYGRVTRVMLGAAGWNAGKPRRLRMSEAGSRVVRLGWFATMPAGLLTAIHAGGQRTDLVTIPPQTSEQDALAAMEQAARPGNREHAPAILAAIGVPGGAPPADRTVIRLRGALDIAAAPALRERLTGVLHPGTSLLVLDLSRVLSCDVSGLAVLIGTQHRASHLGIVMRLAAPSLPVAQLLHSTGLDRCFAIYPDLSGALASQRCEPVRIPPCPTPSRAGQHRGPLGDAAPGRPAQASGSARPVGRARGSLPG